MIDMILAERGDVVASGSRRDAETHRTGARGRDGRHDAIVVGSGIGGLTCAALLATRGLRVLVLEQHAVVGGFCHSFVRGRRRFRFDAAVHDISGLGARRPVRHLLRTLALEDSIDFLRMDHEYVMPDLRLRVPRDPSQFERELGGRFPAEAAAISNFFREARQHIDKEHGAGSGRSRLTRRVARAPGSVSDLAFAG